MNWLQRLSLHLYPSFKLSLSLKNKMFIILFIWNFVSIGARHESLFGHILKKTVKLER